MKKLMMTLAVLGFAAPAFADEQRLATQPAVLDDAALDQVAAGCDTHGTGTVAPVTNVNISPIVVNQTAVAFNTNKQVASNGKGKGKGLIKQSNNQTAVAMNVANINYTVKF